MRTSGLIFLLFFSVNLFAALSKKQLKLAITNTATNLADETSIYLDYGISTTYNAQEDALKAFNPSPLMPQIFSLTSDSVACFINGYGLFTQTVAIPLGIKVDSAGNFRISYNMIDNFDATTIIRVEDRLLNTFKDLRQGAYDFYIDQPQISTGRFFVHISYPVTISTTDADCDNDGGIIAMVADSSFRWTECLLYDSNNTLQIALHDVTGHFSFSNLAEGNYKVAFAYLNYVTLKHIKVDGHQVNITMAASSLNPAPGQTVQFTSLVSNAETYEWSFGDSTIVTGVANPQNAYYAAGTYTVVLKCTNSYGCVSYAYIVVNVGVPSAVPVVSENSIKVFADGRSIVFNQTNAEILGYTVNNILGQPISKGNINSANHRLDLSDQPAGVYIVTVAGKTSSFSKKLLLR